MKYPVKDFINILLNAHVSFYKINSVNKQHKFIIIIILIKYQINFVLSQKKLFVYAEKLYRTLAEQNSMCTTTTII